MLDRIRKALTIPAASQSAPVNPLSAIYFVHAKGSKKLHNTTSPSERTYTACGRWLDGVITVASYPDGGGYWDTKLGQGHAWAMERTPEGFELCKGCWSVTD